MGFYIQRGGTGYFSGPVPSVRMKIDRSPEGGALQVASAGGEGAVSGASARASEFESVLRVEKEKKEGDPGVKRWVEYTIKEGDTLWNLAVKRFHVNVEDLIRDNSIQDPRKIQPGQKIRVRVPSYPERMEVVASWYGKEYHGRPMANGQIYNMHAATIAHQALPLGTRVELENPVTRQRATAVVTDRGPYVEGRDVDLSYGLAKRLSLLEKGVGPLVMRVRG
jgi:rare lipoprotein A